LLFDIRSSTLNLLNSFKYYHFGYRFIDYYLIQYAKVLTKKLTGIEILMENALTIIAVLGGLLFIFSFVKYALIGFRYHPVTGLLALIPVINLITLPTLMDGKVIRTIIIGIVGLLLASASWFLGADKSLYRHISTLRGQPMMTTLEQKTMQGENSIASANSATGLSSQTQIADTKNNGISTMLSSSADTQTAPQPVYLVNLPKQALYSIEFVDASVEKLNTLVGRIVRITTSKYSIVEGKVKKATTSSIFILKNGSDNPADEVLISNIKKIKVLIKRNQ